MLNFTDFQSFYEKRGYCPNDVGVRKKKLNEQQLLARYEKYVKSEEKRVSKSAVIDTKWMEVRMKVFERDGYRCRLKLTLTTSELRELYESSNGIHCIVDPAHVVKKAKYPEITYNADYIVTLNRYSHSCLDSSCHPLNGKPISREEVTQWWRRIEPEYDRLVESLRKLNSNIA